MRSHDLKCSIEYFEAIYNKSKQFELRKNDRDYAVGDYLFLREWDSKKQTYTGRTVGRFVTYVLAGTEHLMPGYVALSLTEFQRR
jgi:hypothetical protein